MKKRVSIIGCFVGCSDTVVLINKVTMCYAADLKESYSRKCKSINRQLLAHISFSNITCIHNKKLLHVHA